MDQHQQQHQHQQQQQHENMRLKAEIYDLQSQLKDQSQQFNQFIGALSEKCGIEIKDGKVDLNDVINQVAPAQEGS